MFVIHKDTEAYRELKRMMEDPTTYKISIDDRTDRDVLSYPGVALKQNESTWTPTLRMDEEETTSN